MTEVLRDRGRVYLQRSAEERKQLVKRLARVEGQVRGIRQMIEDDRHCADELQQVKAAIAGLRAVGMALAKQHVTELVNLMTGDGDAEDLVADLMSVLREATSL